MTAFFSKYKRIILIILCLFAAVILLIIGLKLSFRPESITEENFSEKDKEKISEQLHIDCQNASIEKATFSHAKDSVFVFYISDIEKEDIDGIYYNEVYQPAANPEKIFYDSSENIDISCILDTDTNTAEVKLTAYDDVLYKVLKN